MIFERNLLSYVFYRLNESTATALASARKGQSSRSNEGTAWVESTRAGLSSNQPDGPKTFKAGHNEQHIAQSEDEFSLFLDGIDCPSSDPYVPPEFLKST